MVVMEEAPLVPLTAMAVLLEDLALLMMAILVLGDLVVEGDLVVQDQVTPVLEVVMEGVAPLVVPVGVEETPLVVEEVAPQPVVATTVLEGLVDHLEEEEDHRVLVVATQVPLEVVVEVVLEVAL